MCFGSTPKAQPLPPTAPTPATIADTGVQQARNNAQTNAARATGLSGTQLTVNLDGQGAGNKKLSGVA